LLTLPAKPDLDHLKKQAKQLLRDVRAQQGEALQTIIGMDGVADYMTERSESW
jgi:hypothetical protein